MKLRFPEIVIGSLLTVAIFAMGVMFESSRPSPQGSANSEPTKATEEIKAPSSTEERIADYTEALAILTGILALVGIFQGFMLVRSDKTARLTAEAANLSAKAAIGLQLPFLRIEPGNFSIGASRGEDGVEKHCCSIYSLGVLNNGKSRAFPFELRCGCFMGRDLPEEPIFKADYPLDMTVILEPNANAATDYYISRFEMEIPEDFIQQLRSGTKFWFYCRVSYRDFMNGRHDADFCWRRIESFGDGRFVTDDTPAYNRKT